ncbi:MAG TPA: hypothetical protein VML36_00220 [Nitrospiria bacterium]|nr:hypothetical protein [Nitrospiria bacterium]
MVTGLSWRAATWLGLTVLLASCAGPQRPVLYPNEKLNSVGKEAAQQDINECIRLSVEAGAKTDKAKETAGETVKEGARGAIIGAAVGAVTGNVGEAAAIGAAAGGASGMTEKAFDREVDPVQRGYVDQCLRDRGYQPIGWK